MVNQPQPTDTDTKYQLTFRAWNSYWLECIAERFNRRLDTIFNAMTLIFGASIFAGSDWGWFFGGAIAVFSGCRIAWNFSQRAEAAKQQARRYSILLDEIDQLSADEISARLSIIEEFDSIIMECMDNPARNKACIAMGNNHRESLQITEKLMAALTVGIPR